MATRTLLEAIREALHLELGTDERVILLGEDIGREGGVFRVTEGLQACYGRARVMDAPIAEAGIVGMAVGMAIAGLRPVPEIQFMGFLYPAFDQIISHVARMRNRSRGRFTCPLVVRVPYGGGIHPPEHHSESTEAMLVHTPGLQVVVPATPYDAKGLLISAIRSPDPVIFLEPKRIYRAVRQDIPEEAYTVPIGEARLVREGTDVTVIAWGSMMHTVLQAAESLDASGISLEILDLRTLSPMDVPAIIASVEEDGPRGGRARGPHAQPAWGPKSWRRSTRKPCYRWRPRSSASAVLTPYSPCRNSKSNYLPTPEMIAAAVHRVLAF